MKFKTTLLLVLILLASSAFIKPEAGGFRLSDIQEMVLLPPVGIVSLIGQGNRPVFAPEASTDAAELLRQALNQHDVNLHLTGQVDVKDTSIQRSFAQHVARTIGLLERQRRATMAQPQPWLDTLLTKQKQRFGLVSSIWGFTRTAANRRALIARDLGISLLSMGMAVPATPNASTRIGVFIDDTQTRAIVYYKTNFPTDKDPLAGTGETIDRELTSMLTKDFHLEEAH
jgi:hypothetical protein